MGKINKFNYYSFQDLSLSRPIIEKMIERKKRLKTIFIFLRNEARWDAIGDYPLISFVCAVAKENGYVVRPKEVRNIFRTTSEFKNVQQNSEITKQVCA